MATETTTGPLGELRSFTTAGGGTAITSTAQRIVLPRGAKWMSLTPRNFVTAVVFQFNVNPFLTVFKTTDALADPANMVDYSDNAQDNNTATDVDLSALSTAAANDYVFVGARMPFGGVEIDVDATNSNASVLTVNYWNGSAWTDISATDGTINAGASLGQDGNVTWTVPTAWVSAGINETMTGVAKGLGIAQAEMFWTRWQWSATLDGTTTQNSWISINRNTTYAELMAGQSFEEAVTVGPGGIYSVTAKTDAGTCNLIGNVATRSGGMF